MLATRQLVSKPNQFREGDKKDNPICESRDDLTRELKPVSYLARLQRKHSETPSDDSYRHLTGKSTGSPLTANDREIRTEIELERPLSGDTREEAGRHDSQYDLTRDLESVKSDNARVEVMIDCKIKTGVIDKRENTCGNSHNYRAEEAADRAYGAGLQVALKE